MSDKIYKHPTILLHEDIAQICKPLQRLAIGYFSHVNVNKDGFSAIANHPEFHSYYLENEHYNLDIHMASEDIIKEYLVWDLIKCKEKYDIAVQEAEDMGVKHVFTITEHDHTGQNYYHFASNDFNPGINQVYLSNIDKLKLFILHFKNNVNQYKKLKEAYNIRFKLDYQSGGFEIENTSPHAQSQELFYLDLNPDMDICLPNGKKLSPQQFITLYWLHQGKTIADIATIMNLAEITVNKHIANIKAKTGCYTQFQLGELFANLYKYNENVCDLAMRKLLK